MDQILKRSTAGDVAKAAASHYYHWPLPTAARLSVERIRRNYVAFRN
ncbi:hypothetical protein RDV64_05875 [Acuticoccus sp. MNP-M23]|nr:hypothetical protein [Acuticoccus sp. MNP-M23]WMS43919.1 hypothetical protein RDV64_05875 [Acuticoccus sp. MNP-M23]